MTENTSWVQVSKEGAFVRAKRTFRSQVTADGSSGFKAEPGRYHLYVSYACPWACRTLAVRSLKGLEDVISYDVVDWFLDGTKSWSFQAKTKGATLDTVGGHQYIKEIYFESDPNYNNSFTVPVLYDKKERKIVNNESSEIIRMLNSEFNEFAKNKELDLYPTDLRSKIDEINTWVYDNINDGVYKCGFARSQEAYDHASKNLFDHLDKVEAILNINRYLTGDHLTEADIRLFTTLVRFDLVYYVHFKCCFKRISDYPNIFNYLKELYQIPQIKSTVDFEHIKNHYYYSHSSINPYRIIPYGPSVNLDEPHNRNEKFAKK